MRQFSIKNDRAADLLEQVTRLTRQGKTEAIIRALELYRATLLAQRQADEVARSIHRTVHPHLKPEHRGRAPGKGEIETELDMP